MSVQPNRAADFFDGYARDFSAIYGTRNSLFNRVINRLFRQTMRVRFEQTLAGCQPIEGRTILDVGCGPGHYSVALARAGAASVLGIDFAPNMIQIAREQARQAGMEGVCEFLVGDFLTHQLDSTFDYSVVMGFMDYIANPERLVEKVAGLTRSRAFFSFPQAGGFLAWQRKLRYRNRCELYLYTRENLDALLRRSTSHPFTVQDIGRDFFVTIDCSIKKPVANAPR